MLLSDILSVLFLSTMSGDYSLFWEDLLSIKVPRGNPAHFSQDVTEEQERMHDACREKVRCCTEEDFEKLVKEPLR